MSRTMIVALTALVAVSLNAAERVAEGVWLQRGSFEEGSQPDGNSVIIEAPEGLIVIDTGRHEAHTRALLDFATDRDREIAAIVNTHWHLDHVGGNVIIRAAMPDVAVIGTGAIANARTDFLANYRTQLETMIGAWEGSEAGLHALVRERALIDAADQFEPTTVINEAGGMEVGGRRLEFRVARPAATEADLWIVDRENDLVIAGDLVTLPTPFLDTADVDGWSEALAEISRTDFNTLVPGHGEPMTRDAFERYRSAFEAFVDCSKQPQRTHAECAEVWVRSAGNLIAEEDRDRAAMMATWYVEKKLRGE